MEFKITERYYPVTLTVTIFQSKTIFKKDSVT